MKRLTLAICLLASGVNANSALTVNEFLLQAQDDANVLWSSEAYTQPHSDNSWIENAEIRYSDDNDRDNKQALALRLKPKGFGQRSAEDAILNLRQKQRSLMFDSVLNDALKLRYAQLLDLLTEQSLVNRLEQQIALIKNELKLQHELAYTDDFRPDELLQSELQADQLQKKVQSHRKRLSDLYARLRINQLPKNIVTIDNILAIVATKQEPLVGNEVKAARLKMEIAQQQRRLDRARQGVSLSLMELKYERAERKDDTLGMTVGIRIPFGASYTNSKRAYDVADAMYDLQLQQHTNQRNAETLNDMLHWQKTQANTAKATLKDIAQRMRLATDSGNTGLLLALKKQQLEEKGKLADIHYQALRHYFNYLSITGQLAKAPLRNWLISGQPAL